MTRMYIQPSFVDSCSDHGEWSGGNGQYRGDRSVEVVPTYINGKPNVKAFSDEAIAARRAKKTSSVPLIDRVLPQQRRVRVLTEQLYELEAERKKGLDINTYSQLRDILIVKRDRAELLLQKALSVKPIRDETEENGVEMYVPIHDMAQDYDGCKDEPFAWLSSENCTKKILQKACKALKGVVHFSQKAKSYWNELKEV